MISKILAISTAIVSVSTVGASYTQRAAFHLGEEKQTNYWPRHRTQLSGRYRRGVWVPLPSRQSFGGFQGGGPNSGK